jgi:hypothetical protein
MSKQRMIAAALEELYDSEDDGAEHPATLRRRIFTRHRRVLA